METKAPSVGDQIYELSKSEQRKLRDFHIVAIFQDRLTSLDPLFTVGRQLTETIRVHHPGNAATAGERALQLLCEVDTANPKNCFSQYPHQFSICMP